MTTMLRPTDERIEPVDCGDRGFPGLTMWPVGNAIGEGPNWDASTGMLLWIDVKAPAVLRLDPGTSTVSRWTLPEAVGALGLAGPGSVVVALKRSLAILELEAGRLETIASVDGEPPGNRLNDGKVSPSGRWFVFGSMDDRDGDRQRTGSLYRVGFDGSVRKLADGLAVANGTAWTPDGSMLHWSDSTSGRIWRAPWNDDDGTIGAPSTFAVADESVGRPDGAAVDIEGHYWSAGVSAGCLNRYAPDGSIVQRIGLPCRGPTMPCFGGDAITDLYVTSLARPGWNAPPDGPDGALYRLPAGVRGVVPGRWDLRRDRAADPPNG